MLRRSYVHERVCELSSSPLQLPVSTRFQILFQPPPGVLFSFPSRYLFTIDQYMYLALAHSRARFLQGFTCPAVLRNHIVMICYVSFTGLSPSLVLLSRRFNYITICNSRQRGTRRYGPTTPTPQRPQPFSTTNRDPKTII